MRFPKAYQGVKLLFIAEILGVVTTVIELGLLAFTFQPNPADALSLGMKGGALVGSSFIMLPLAIASLILLFVGLGTAKADEREFRTALILQIVYIAAAVVLTVVTVISVVAKVMPEIMAGNTQVMPSASVTSPMYTLLFGVIGNVMSTCIWFCVAAGIGNLARKLEDGPMEAKARSFSKIIIAFGIVSIVLSVVSYYVQNANPGATFNLPTVISTVLSIVLVLLIIVFLGRAKKMLAK